jgi:hypothetical protein
MSSKLSIFRQGFNRFLVAGLGGCAAQTSHKVLSKIFEK